MPRILVTNDDGIDSEGLHVLARRMEDHGEVVVVAPDREYSGASAALGPLHLIRPEAQRAHVHGVAEAWAVSGPPGLCVMFAVMGAFAGPFDLVVAGINPGENTGRAVYHSGTVGAVVTARCRSVSGVAVSQAVRGPSVEGQGEEDDVVGQHWATAATVAATVVAGLLASPPKAAIAMNVNVPNVDVDQLRHWRSTTLATLPARALASATLRPKPGHTGAFRIEMAWGEPAILGPDTDGGAVASGEVSITALGAYTETEVNAAPGVADALSRRWSQRR
ncbi:MAG: 5'/3'-nucleotidase SurE [Actinomycetota bacterium]|nr:5'/3'-nucleotidase SurE [Actinomycetota bacterium]